MHVMLHVPDLGLNLISVIKIILKGLKVHFNSLECVVNANKMRC
jgi:hypothetical protein